MRLRQNLACHLRSEISCLTTNLESVYQTIMKETPRPLTGTKVCPAKYQSCTQFRMRCESVSKFIVRGFVEMSDSWPALPGA